MRDLSKLASSVSLNPCGQNVQQVSQISMCKVIWCYFCSSVLKIMRQRWRGERKNKAVGFDFWGNNGRTCRGRKWHYQFIRGSDKRGLVSNAKLGFYPGNQEVLLNIQCAPGISKTLYCRLRSSNWELTHPALHFAHNIQLVCSHNYACRPLSMFYTIQFFMFRGVDHRDALRHHQFLEHPHLHYYQILLSNVTQWLLPQFVSKFLL